MIGWLMCVSKVVTCIYLIFNSVFSFVLEKRKFKKSNRFLSQINFIKDALEQNFYLLDLTSNMTLRFSRAKRKGNFVTHCTWSIEAILVLLLCSRSRKLNKKKKKYVQCWVISTPGEDGRKKCIVQINAFNSIWLILLGKPI